MGNVWVTNYMKYCEKARKGMMCFNALNRGKVEGSRLSWPFNHIQYPLIWEQGVGGSNPLAPTTNEPLDPVGNHLGSAVFCFSIPTGRESGHRRVNLPSIVDSTP